MEENIHDDKLDDYVRKSFEGHEEDPPSDMWSRVEGDLLPPVGVFAPRPVYLRYGWQALAAAVILVLFSTLVCEHFYYEEKLKNLVGKPLEQREILSKNNTAGESTEQQAQPNTNSQSLPQVSLPEPNATKSNLEKPSNPESVAVLGNAPRPQQAGMAVRPSQDVILPKSEAPVPQNAQGLSDKADSKPSSVGVAYLEDSLVLPITESDIANSKTPNTIEIGFVPISRSLLKGPSLSSPVLALIPIKPVHQPSGWYVGVQTSLLASIEKSRTPISRPGRPTFSSKQENTGTSAFWWLKTGKKLNTRFSLESGIGYQKTNRTAIHSPRFKFGDGSPSAPLSTRRIYNYDVTTYGGTAEVSLRMDQTTPSTPVQDNEPVSLRITTSERTELARIPIIAGYRFGNGRCQGQLKAGLLGNFVLKNELDISAWVSQNTRFQPVMGRDGYTVRLNQKKFFLGYWLSAGAEFKLNQRFSLITESAFVGDFKRNDQYSRQLPQRFMLGLNVGANYYF